MLVYVENNKSISSSCNLNWIWRKSDNNCTSRNELILYIQMEDESTSEPTNKAVRSYIKTESKKRNF